MKDAPVVLGINRTQDASVCLMQGPRLLWAIQKERLTRRRHHHGKVGDFRDLYGPCLPWPERPIDAVVECGSSDDDAARLALYEDELTASLRLAPDCRRVRISHHLAHLYGAFHPSAFRDAAVMVVDGQGSPVSALTEHWGGAAYVHPDWREVASFYRADRERVLCIDKQVWDRDDARLAGLGIFHARLTQVLFPGEGNEGKVTDLAAHGDARALGLPALEVEAGQVGMPGAWLAVLQERERFRYGRPGAFDDCANLAAAGQRAFEDALLATARWLHAQTGLARLCLAGGAAFNSRANGRLRRESPFQDVFVPPAPGSAGSALGCALYGLVALCHDSAAFRWTHDGLGPVPARRDIEAALHDRDGLNVDYLPGIDALASRMLDLLCHGRVLALYQGPAEFGPRALGQRSVLADPRRAVTRAWINAQVRQHDPFRQPAAMVLEERAAAWADLRAPSPFLQFDAPVHPHMAARAPAIVHADGSVRLQTVGPAAEPLLRRLLAGFEAHTGVPLLLNTAFKGKEAPLVETPQEAVAAFRQLPLHALAMPPFLVTKRVEPALPA